MVKLKTCDASARYVDNKKKSTGHSRRGRLFRVAHQFKALDEMGYKGPIGLECWPGDNGEIQAIKDVFKRRPNTRG